VKNSHFFASQQIIQYILDSLTSGVNDAWSAYVVSVLSGKWRHVLGQQQYLQSPRSFSRTGDDNRPPGNVGCRWHFHISTATTNGCEL